MTYAVVKILEKQYKVLAGDSLLVEGFLGEKDEKLKFDKILLFVDNSDVRIGSPFVLGASVEAVIVDKVKGEKINILQYKAKSNYRRRVGFRSEFTKILINDIKSGSKGSSETTEKKTAAVLGVKPA